MTSTVPTPDVPDQPSTAVEKPAGELKVGDWLHAFHTVNARPSEILGVHPYTDPDEGSYVLLVYAAADEMPATDTLNAEAYVTLATDDDVQAARTNARRLRVAALVGELADLIESRDLPMGRPYDFPVLVISSTPEQVARAGEILGIEVETRGRGVSVTWPKPTEGKGATFAARWDGYLPMQPDPTPAAEPLPQEAPAAADTGLDFSREPDALTATPVPKGVDGRPVGKRTPAKAGRP